MAEYRVRLAREERNWTEAKRLQTVCVEWDRKRAEPYLEMPPDKLDKTARNVIRTLAVSLHELGQIQREMSDAACVGTYKESLKLLEDIKNKAATAQTVFNLGHAYKNIPAIRDIEKAGKWYALCLELRSERDRQGRAQCLGQMGYVAWERFQEASAAQKPNEELMGYVNVALRHYHTALEMIPGDAVDDLAVTHNQLGQIYRKSGEIDQAVLHYNQSIKYQEVQGNFYNAGGTRFNIALAQSNRIPDALDYARAALQNFEMYGDRAADMIDKTKKLIQGLSELE